MNQQPQIVVIGSLNADLVQKVERLPKPGETIAGGSLETFSGGKGANQAVAAGRMGARTSMIGQVGDDSLSQILRDSLEGAGVDHDSVGVSKTSTGSAVILVFPDGENVIVIAPGANATVTPELAADRLRVLERGAFLLSQLEIPIESVERSLEVAKARGATTILDPAPARELSGNLLSHVDYLTPNETESATLLGDPGLAMEDGPAMEAAAERILALGPKSVVLKLGSRGCLIASAEGFHRVPGFKVEAVDTTAAGDVFNGAFATALAEGQAVPYAARFANAAAALSVTRPGAQDSVPSREAVDRFLRAATA